MINLLSYSHLFFVALVFAGPVAALALLRRPLDATTATRLRRVDTLNGLAATLVLVIGLVRLFYVGKGPDYYFHSLPFVSKLVLYAVASGLSLVSTLEIRRWAAALKTGDAPLVSRQKLGQMRRALGWQLVCVLGMAGCAALASRGLGAL